MTTTPNILGLDTCSCRRSAQDIVDSQVWAPLEALHPGLMRDLYGMRAPGERSHVPKELESPRARARRLDDGMMSVRTLAMVADVGYETGKGRARNEKGIAICLALVYVCLQPGDRQLAVMLLCSVGATLACGTVPGLIFAEHQRCSPLGRGDCDRCCSWQSRKCSQPYT